MRSLLSTLALSLASLATTLVGCADPPAPQHGGAVAEKPAPKRDDRYAELSAEDCQTWADHFSTRLREATQRRITECAIKVKEAGGTPTSDAKDLASTNAEADRLHTLIIDQCGQQVGAAYVKSDAQCYMDAKKLEDWKSCPFESMFFSDYKAVAKNHEKLFDDRCRTELQNVTSGAAASAG